MSDKFNRETNCMQVEYVNIVHDSFFTKERIAKWKIFIAKCCRDVCERVINKVDPVCGVSYFLSTSLVKDIVGDAVVGMTKIIDKTPHPVEEPNAFKIAAYLGYWFLRQKPVCILYPEGVDLDNIKVANDCNTDAKFLSWQLKHINETIAVDMVTTFIFDFKKNVCESKQCKNIMDKNKVDGKQFFAFDSFDQQRRIMMQKLTYYFSYRAIAPKVIEHILEGYAFHPAWGLTGPHWNTKIKGNIYEE